MNRLGLVATLTALFVVTQGDVARSSTDQCGEAGQACCVGDYNTAPCNYANLTCINGICTNTLNYIAPGTALVSDVDGVAPTTDPVLIEPWSLVVTAGGPWLVANAGSGTVTSYDGAGGRVGPTIHVPGRPTGGVSNAGDAFYVSGGGVSGPARYLWASEEGRIHALPAGAGEGMDDVDAEVLIDSSKAGKRYTGLALFSTGDAASDRLYAVDFANGTVDVWDGTAMPVATEGAFFWSDAPDGMAPFGIQEVGGAIWVTYAQRNDDGSVHEGKGTGRVATFDGDGNFIAAIETFDELDAPWGIAKAPPGDPDSPSDCVLVGNTGDGHINVYCSGDDGHYSHRGQVEDSEGAAISVDGLHGIAFGNGGEAGGEGSLYFSARHSFIGGTGWWLGVFTPVHKGCTCTCHGITHYVIASVPCPEACLIFMIAHGCM